MNFEPAASFKNSWKSFVSDEDEFSIFNFIYKSLEKLTFELTWVSNHQLRFRKETTSASESNCAPIGVETFDIQVTRLSKKSHATAARKINKAEKR